MKNMKQKLGTYVPDNLIAGTHVTQVIKGITVKKGTGALMRGTVMGEISASGLCVPVDKSKSDGSQNPYCVLTDNIVIEQSEDVITTGYFTGVFNQRALKFGASDTYADHMDGLRKVGIHLLETQQ